MKHRHTRALYDYWNRLRAGAPAPRRGVVEPADIRAQLGDTFILDASSRPAVPFRLAGTRLCSLYGREMKNRDFQSLFVSRDGGAVETLVAAVSVDAAAAVVGLEGRNDRGDTIALEMLLLPLSNGSLRYDRILGILVPMENPYWLGLHAVMEQRVTSMRLLWPEEQPAHLRRHAEIAKTVPSVPDPIHLVGERRAHLIVLEGGKR